MSLAQNYRLDIQSSREDYHIFVSIADEALKQCSSHDILIEDADLLFKRMSATLSSAQSKAWRNGGSYRALPWIHTIRSGSTRQFWDAAPRAFADLVTALRASVELIDGGSVDLLRLLNEDMASIDQPLHPPIFTFNSRTPGPMLSTLSTYGYTLGTLPEYLDSTNAAERSSTSSFPLTSRTDSVYSVVPHVGPNNAQTPQIFQESLTQPSGALTTMLQHLRAVWPASRVTVDWTRSTSLFPQLPIGDTMRRASCFPMRRPHLHSLPYMASLNSISTRSTDVNFIYLGRQSQAAQISRRRASASSLSLGQVHAGFDNVTYTVERNNSWQSNMETLPVTSTMEAARIYSAPNACANRSDQDEVNTEANLPNTGPNHNIARPRQHTRSSLSYHKHWRNGIVIGSGATDDDAQTADSDCIYDSSWYADPAQTASHEALPERLHVSTDSQTGSALSDDEVTDCAPAVTSLDRTLFPSTVLEPAM